VVLTMRKQFHIPQSVHREYQRTQHHDE
jgi:hypothetical protein